LAKASAKSYGMPDLPLLIVPHPFETLDRTQLERIADEKLSACIALVTRTLHH
jgi:hypothetical protein